MYKNESRSIGYYLNSSNSQFETCNDGSIKCYDSININCLSATGDRQSDIYTCVSVCESSCTYRTFNENSKRVKFSCFVDNEIYIENNTEEVKEEATNFLDSLNDQIDYKLVVYY